MTKETLWEGSPHTWIINPNDYGTGGAYARSPIKVNTKNYRGETILAYTVIHAIDYRACDDLEIMLNGKVVALVEGSCEYYNHTTTIHNVVKITKEKYHPNSAEATLHKFHIILREKDKIQGLEESTE